MPVRTSRRSRRLAPFFRGAGFASSAMPYAPAFFGAAAAAGAAAGAEGAAAGFFLTITPRLGPLRVRALVWVRWPLTGRPRRPGDRTSPKMYVTAPSPRFSLGRSPPATLAMCSLPCSVRAPALPAQSWGEASEEGEAPLRALPLSGFVSRILTDDPRHA